MARLSTNSSEIEEREIRATLLGDSFGAEDFSLQPIEATNSLHSLHELERADLSFCQPNSAELIKHCHVCDAETFLGDKFCQECGSVQPAFEEGKGSLSADMVKQLVVSNSKSLLAIIAACVLFLSLLVGIVSVLGASDDLEKALATNRLNDAVALSERLKVLHFGVLVGRDAELYSDAFLKRAQVYAKNGSFRLALFDLAKVLPNYTRSMEVSQLKNIYLGQLNGGAFSGVGTVPLYATTPVAVTAPTSGTTSLAGTASASRTDSFTRTAAASRFSAAKSSVASASNPSSKDLSLEAQTAPSEPTAFDAEEVNSEEADMAAYNRHLADYFSRQDTQSSAAPKSRKNTKNTKSTKDTNDTKETLAKDPPSFSEWVQSGKTEF